MELLLLLLLPLLLPLSVRRWCTARRAGEQYSREFPGLASLPEAGCECETWKCFQEILRDAGAYVEIETGAFRVKGSNRSVVVHMVMKYVQEYNFRRGFYDLNSKVLRVAGRFSSGNRCHDSRRPRDTRRLSRHP